KGSAITYDNSWLVGYKLGRLTRMPFGGTTTSNGTSTSQPQLTTAYRNAAVTLGTSYKAITSVPLPKNKAFNLTAKTILNDGAGTGVDCYLDGGGQVSNAARSFGGPSDGQTGLYFQEFYSAVSNAATATLWCKVDNTTFLTSVTFSRISALQVL